ncbi:MAG: 30S ribosome-binding factor RbfA [Gammaproteobacteria bacterium]|jgi:ribosome-binding factor A
MPREYGRNRRVADLVQRELAVCIQREMSDTPLKFVTVSGVDVSPDLKNARVYVTSLEDNLDKDRVVADLNERAGHYRHHLSKKLSLRSVPRLTFVFDYSVERGRRLTDLIDAVSKHDE